VPTWRTRSTLKLSLAHAQRRRRVDQRGLIRSRNARKGHNWRMRYRTGGLEVLLRDKPKPIYTSDELVALGAEKMGSSKDAAEKSDVTITMLPDGPDVDQVILGPRGVLGGSRRGSIVIDVSPVTPLVATRVAIEIEKKGVEMLDARVSG
jgi:3-hydroxyisobutyrate dehydrogenase-like beta-hydroxyacid dehydrogenase